MCLFGVQPAVTHLRSPARAASIVVLVAAAAVAAPAARRTDQHGRERRIDNHLSNLFGIRNLLRELLTLAPWSPRPGLVFPSSRPRKSRVPFRPGNAGLFGAYYGMLEDQACIHRRGTSVAPDKLAFGPRSRAGHVWVARRENSAHQNSALDALPRMSCLVAQYRSRPERSSSDCLIASVAMCVC